MHDTIRLFAAFALSVPEYQKFVHKLETGDVPVPARSAVYQWCVKMDWVNMLWQRRLWTEARKSGKSWSSQLASDASSQSGFEFFCTVESRLEFDGSVEEIAQRAAVSGALRCFKWSRRALPVQVLGLGAAGVAQKFGLCAKTLMQETDPDDLDERRLTIAGRLADQGTELAIGDCPYEDATNFKSLVTRLIAGEADFRDLVSRGVYFLPDCITLPEMLHIIFNALQEALQSTAA